MIPIETALRKIVKALSSDEIVIYGEFANRIMTEQPIFGRKITGFTRKEWVPTDEKKQQIINSERHYMKSLNIVRVGSLESSTVEYIIKVGLVPNMVVHEEDEIDLTLSLKSTSGDGTNVVNLMHPSSVRFTNYVNHSILYNNGKFTMGDVFPLSSSDCSQKSPKFIKGLEVEKTLVHWGEEHVSFSGLSLEEISSRYKKVVNLEALGRLGEVVEKYERIYERSVHTQIMKKLMDAGYAVRGPLHRMVLTGASSYSDPSLQNRVIVEKMLPAMMGEIENGETIGGKIREEEVGLIGCLLGENFVVNVDTPNRHSTDVFITRNSLRVETVEDDQSCTVRVLVDIMVGRRPEISPIFRDNFYTVKETDGNGMGRYTNRFRTPDTYVDARVGEDGIKALLKVIRDDEQFIFKNQAESLSRDCYETQEVLAEINRLKTTTFVNDTPSSFFIRKIKESRESNDLKIPPPW